jgi:hypothetical protein
VACDNDCLPPSTARLNGNWQNAADGTNRTGQGQFSDKAEFAREWQLTFFGARDTESDWQVETRAFFLRIGRGEIDCGASAGPPKPLFWTAVVTLSLLSFTAASGRPTTMITGLPRIAGMNERDLDAFLNDPGDLFVRQCERLWQEMWTLSNDGEHSMTLRKIAEAISLYLELPGIRDKASAADQENATAHPAIAVRCRAPILARDRCSLSAQRVSVITSGVGRRVVWHQEPGSRPAISSTQSGIRFAGPPATDFRIFASSARIFSTSSSAR